jgi:hypothetical protein
VLSNTQNSPATAATSSADRQAARNWAANLRALEQVQPGLPDLVQALPAGVEWIFGRDGTLTGRTTGGRWLAGCSLPHLAAQAMLRDMNVPGGTACFIAPAHAAQLAAALDQLQPEQALLAVIAEPHDCRLFLCCCDFSAALAAGRLRFTTGEQWPTQLQKILEQHPGLPLPQQLIRTPGADPVVLDTLIATAQATIAAAGEQRTARLRSLQNKPRTAPHPRTFCLLARSRFRLWEDAGEVLARTVRKAAAPRTVLEHVDPDHPLTAAPMALALAAVEAEAVVAADVARCDLPQVVRDEIPWVTWLTIPRAIPASTAGPRDRLLVADPAWIGIARGAGWDEERLAVAAWPAAGWPPIDPAAPPSLGLIHDTCSLEPGEAEENYSSHRLLWQLIREELLADPFLLPRAGSPAVYLAQRMQRAGIADEGFNQARFIQGLIVPAWQQGLVRILIEQGLPLRLYGRGWAQLGSCRQHSAGEVKCRASFHQAVLECAALLYPWPIVHAHQIDALGRPVLRLGTSPSNFVHAARQMLRKPPLPSPVRSPLCAAVALAGLV